jgi:hypothetical protein
VVQRRHGLWLEAFAPARRASRAADVTKGPKGWQAETFRLSQPQTNMPVI